MTLHCLEVIWCLIIYLVSVERKIKKNTVGDKFHFTFRFGFSIGVLFAGFIQESFCSSYAQSLAKEVTQVFSSSS